MLPNKYLEKMKTLLKDEYDLYLDSFNKTSFHGLRVNTLKISVEDFIKIFPYKLERIPWTSDGFYYEDESVSKHPFYCAGLYYLQEPSAMLPAEVLPINHNDIVLDACSAPGGKATKLGVKLNESGLLISNDISSSRQHATLKNIERFGIKNAIVLSEDLNNLLDKFEGKFDKILLDAPCSGEGMFRKEPSLIKSWLNKDSSYYAPIQKELIKNAYHLLKYGGMMVYSTCTFDQSEDEEVIKYALETFKDLKVIPIKQYDGFSTNEYGTKLYPHKINGEGHFVSLLMKGENTLIKPSSSFIPVLPDYIKEYKTKLIDGHIETINDSLYFVNEFKIKGLRILSSGLKLGQVKNKEFEPSQAFALSLKMNEAPKYINLNIDDIRVIKYLKGETIKLDEYTLDGYILLCVDSFPLGFIKITNGIVKNKIDKGWIIN